MKFADMKIGQVVSASFPNEPDTVPELAGKTFGFRITGKTDTCVCHQWLNVKNVKTDESMTFTNVGDDVKPDWANWTLIEDVVQ